LAAKVKRFCITANILKEKVQTGFRQAAESRSQACRKSFTSLPKVIHKPAESHSQACRKSFIFLGLSG
jgi:hypothetical protein